jgi:serine/threonine protein kinase
MNPLPSVEFSVLGRGIRITDFFNQGAFGRIYRTNDPEFLVKVAEPGEEVAAALGLVEYRERARLRYQALVARKFSLDAELDCLPRMKQEALVPDGSRAPCFLMKLARGEPLRPDLPRPGSGNLVTAKGVVAAFRKLHALGVVQVDVKLDNIIRLPNGDVRLIDVDGGSLRGGFVPMGEVSDAFAAPEVYRPGIEPGDFEGHLIAEHWAVAVLLYRLLVDGKGPFPIAGVEQPYPRNYIAGLQGKAPEWPRRFQSHLMAQRKLPIAVCKNFERTFRSSNAHQRTDLTGWQLVLRGWQSGEYDQPIGFSPPLRTPAPPVAVPLVLPLPAKGLQPGIGVALGFVGSLVLGALLLSAVLQRQPPTAPTVEATDNIVVDYGPLQHGLRRYSSNPFSVPTWSYGGGAGITLDLTSAAVRSTETVLTFRAVGGPRPDLLLYEPPKAGKPHFINRMGMVSEELYLLDGTGAKLYSLSGFEGGSQSWFNTSARRINIAPGEVVELAVRFSAVSESASTLTFVSPRLNGWQAEWRWNDIPLRGVEVVAEEKASKLPPVSRLEDPNDGIARESDSATARFRANLRAEPRPLAPAAPPPFERPTPSEAAQSSLELAQSLFSEHRYDEARQACNRALEVDPGNSRARELLRTIERTLAVLSQP